MNTCKNDKFQMSSEYDECRWRRQFSRIRIVVCRLTFRYILLKPSLAIILNIFCGDKIADTSNTRTKS